MSETQDVATAVGHRVRETSLVLTLSLAVLVVGSLVFWVTSSDQALDPALLTVVVGTLGWRSLLWVGATVVVATRVDDRAARRRWGIAAAPLASIVVDIVAFGPSFASAQGALIVWVIQWVLGAAFFAASVAIGWMLTARLRPEPGQAPPAPLWRMLPGPLLAVGFLAALALFRQGIGLYLRFGSSDAPVIADFDPEGIRYLVTASIAVGATAAGIMLALVRRSIWLAVLGFILLPVVLLAAFVFQVPHDRWTREPPRPENTRPACLGDEPVDYPGCEGG
jgi:hypothetical protein